MPYYRLTYFILFMLVLLSTAGAQTMRENLQEEIEKIIFYDTEITNEKIPGYTIGIIVHDSTFVFHYGHADLQGHALTDSSQFEIGGLTKVFTATLIEQLVQEGILTYDLVFNECLPQEFRNPHLAHLTIEHLVTHRSGFPKLPAEFGLYEKHPDDPFIGYPKKQLLKYYQEFQPRKKQKDKYFYSGINYALLEIAVEQMCREKFDEVLRKKVLQPAKLADTGIELPSIKRVVGIHNVNKMALQPRHYASFGGALGLKSSIRDLLQFLAVNLGQQSNALTQIWQATHQPVCKTEMSKFTWSGKGWHIVKNRKYYDAVMHSGSTSGHRAYLGFVQESKTAVIVLSNSEHSTNGLGFLILRLINNNWKKPRKK